MWTETEKRIHAGEKNPLTFEKGDLIVESNGWPSIILDGFKKRPTRLCYVFGLYAEMGSIYTLDATMRLTRDQFMDLVRKESPQSVEEALKALLKYGKKEA